jgi:hypothetical protein
MAHYLDISLPEDNDEEIIFSYYIVLEEKNNTPIGMIIIDHGDLQDDIVYGKDNEEINPKYNSSMNYFLKHAPRW